MLKYHVTRGSSSMVEPQPSKLVVAGSSPVCRSTKKPKGLDNQAFFFFLNPHGTRTPTIHSKLVLWRTPARVSLGFGAIHT